MTEWRALDEYIGFWREAVAGEDGLWIHPEDRNVLIGAVELADYSGKAFTTYEDYTSSRLFAYGEPGRDDKRDRGKLRLGLVPHTHLGDLATAKLVICNLNPGFEHADYHAELHHSAYKVALLANLYQESPSFIFLEREFAWTGGYRWWRSKWGSVWDGLRIDEGHTREFLAKHVAAVELFPYHSTNFGLGKPKGYVKTKGHKGAWWSSLESVKQAQKLFAEYLVPLALRGDIVVAVMRGADTWMPGLSKSELANTGGLRVLASSSSRSGRPDRSMTQMAIKCLLQ